MTILKSGHLILTGRETAQQLETLREREFRRVRDRLMEANRVGRIDEDTLKEVQGYRRVWAQIWYYPEVSPHILTWVLWDKMDMAPHYPSLRLYIERWQTEPFSGRLHSMKVWDSERRDAMDYRAVDEFIRIH